MTPEQFLSATSLHADSLNDFKTWEALLRKWNRRINLVASGTVDDFWSRHALDSAQILPHIPENAKTIVDFGSGAGFPAIALAIHGKHAKLGWQIHAIESAGKKASFLKSVSRETSTAMSVLSKRIENIDPINADIITARAFAPLIRIFPLAVFHMKQSGRLVLLKGESLSEEMYDVQENWSFDYETYPSSTSPTGQIIIITNLRSKT